MRTKAKLLHHVQQFQYYFDRKQNKLHQYSHRCGSNKYGGPLRSSREFFYTTCDVELEVRAHVKLHVRTYFEFYVRTWYKKNSRDDRNGPP